MSLKVRRGDLAEGICVKDTEDTAILHTHIQRGGREASK